MIVKEKNWDGELFNEFKNTLITNLFDKVGVAISTKCRNNLEGVTEEFLDTYDTKVKSYFAEHIAKGTRYADLLPVRLKDVEKFYILGIHVLPTGGVLITFIALLGGRVEPCELQMMY